MYDNILECIFSQRKKVHYDNICFSPIIVDGPRGQSLTDSIALLGLET